VEQDVPGEGTAPAAAARQAPSLAKASGSMAIATLVSRITGFFWKIMLAWVVGTDVVSDSFTIANTLPNIIFELLLGGVLASIVVPLLVRSQDDRDGGAEYTNRLLTVGLTGLAVGTVAAVAAAPLFTLLYVDGSTGRASPELVTSFAYLLLPEILFYCSRCCRRSCKPGRCSGRRPGRRWSTTWSSSAPSAATRCCPARSPSTRCG
jgi:putative peptidoglycan lipid II flippase